MVRKIRLSSVNIVGAFADLVDQNWLEDELPKDDMIIDDSLKEVMRDEDEQKVMDLGLAIAVSHTKLITERTVDSFPDEIRGRWGELDLAVFND
ncbi:hypothetical protein AKO1_003733 [Acrasis kona]|uniref:Uncharacterized protein n=1 Tax=Acrasis kona TaxID=1008807 RepID=A0AAW2Z5E9_9EUKA